MKTRNWTDEERDYLRKNFIKDGSVKCGKALDRNHRNVGCMAHYLGLRRGWGDRPRFRKYSIKHDIFKSWTMESAYLVGLILADGNISTEGRSFSISSNDFELLEKSRNALESEHPIKDIPNKNLYILAIGHKGIVDDLEKIGITQNNSKTLSMPAIPEKYFFHFLRGYIDGDGMIVYRYKKGIHLKLCTGSPYILDNLSDTISNFLHIHRHKPAARTGKRRDTVSTWYELSYYGSNAAKICDAVYSHCDDLFLSRKRQAFIDYRDRPKTLGLRNNGNATKYK